MKKRVILVLGLIFIMISVIGCGDNISREELRDRELLNFLGIDPREIPGANCLNCPYPLDPSVTLRDVAEDQYTTHQLIQETRKWQNRVDVTVILDEVEDVFWESVKLPANMLLGGVIAGSGIEALKILWQIKRVLNPPGVGLGRQIGELLHATGEYAQNRSFLNGQFHSYFCSLRIGWEVDYNQESFTISSPFNERVHENLWDSSAWGDPERRYLPTAMVGCGFNFRFSEPTDPERIPPTYVKDLTKEAWKLAYANYLLEIDKADLREQILACACSEVIAPTQIFTPVLSPIPTATQTAVACPPEGEKKFTQGEEVITTDELRVRINPGIAEQEIKTQPKWTYGTILKGPACQDNYVWWKVEYQDGTIGWSAEDWLKVKVASESKIAYIRSDTGRIYLVNADGSDERQLSSGETDFHFEWLQDGRRILYNRGSHDFEGVFLIDVQTGEETKILAGKPFLKLSPDGQKFLYLEGEFGNESLAIFDLESRSSRRLPIQQTYKRLELGFSLGITSLIWSPEGKRIAYIDNNFVDPQTDLRGTAVWMVDLETLQKQILWENTLGSVENPISLSWSPDGEKIGFARTLVRQGLGHVVYELLDLNSRSLQTVLDISYEPKRCFLSKLMDVYWTQEGARVVLSFPRNCWQITSSISQVEPKLSSPGIWLFEEGKEPKRLSELSSDALGNAIDISPDGTFLVFASEAQLYTINTDGTNLTKIVELGWQPIIAP